MAGVRKPAGPVCAPSRRIHLAAVAAAMLAAIIWSSSFVGVKFLLRYTGPFTVSGVRFLGAFVVMLPWVIVRFARGKPLACGTWIRLSVIGVAHYTVGNGILYIALETLSPTVGSLALCMAPLPVLLIGMVRLKEKPRSLQVAGIVLTLIGSVLFFSHGWEAARPLSLIYVAIAVLGIALGPVVSREVARERTVDTVLLTAVPFGVGGGLLMVVAVAAEGIPQLPLAAWGVLFALIVVNTVAAFLLFNRSLRHLAAFEANVLWNLMPVGTALIAWGALGENLTWVQIVAMGLIVVGATVAQSRVTARRIRRVLRER